MAELKASSIQLEEIDLRVALEFYCKAITRQANTSTDQEVADFYKKKLAKFQRALATINQTELPILSRQK